MTQQHDHEHEHVHEHGDETYGIALGVRIFEEGGDLYLAEAEISPYVDSPDELGATLVFHPLGEVDPAEMSEDEIDWPAFTIDIDDELTRRSSDAPKQQFQAIARQLMGLTEDELREYLRSAKEGA